MKKDNKTSLVFCGASTTYGIYDSDLLKKVLDEHLDQRIKYSVR